MSKKIFHIDANKTDTNNLFNLVYSNWKSYSIYHIFNMPSEIDYRSYYKKMAYSLGDVRLCHPVNDKTTNFSNSRDIKYTPGINHYYASNSRQPLHNDYAYYEQNKTPEWLMIYCVTPSEFGGKTHIVSVKTLTDIMMKYNPDLLEEITVDVVWQYEGVDGNKVHKKPIYDGYEINWNYSQIKECLNSKDVIETKHKFHGFLESFIVGGSIYDFSKEWKAGDCIIFNDRLNLHGRDAFFGNRWLKDHAFYDKNTINKIKGVR